MGDIPAAVDFKALLAHAQKHGSPKWADIYNWKGKGTGAIGYATDEEAQLAIANLSGTKLRGGINSCDEWQKRRNQQEPQQQWPPQPPPAVSPSLRTAASSFHLPGGRRAQFAVRGDAQDEAIARDNLVRPEAAGVATIRTS